MVDGEGIVNSIVESIGDAGTSQPGAGPGSTPDSGAANAPAVTPNEFIPQTGGSLFSDALAEVESMLAADAPPNATDAPAPEPVAPGAEPPAPAADAPPAEPDAIDVEINRVLTDAGADPAKANPALKAHLRTVLEEKRSLEERAGFVNDVGHEIAQKGARFMERYHRPDVDTAEIWNDLADADMGRLEQLFITGAENFPDAAVQQIFGEGVTREAIQAALEASKGVEPTRVANALKLLDYAESQVREGRDVFDDEFDLDAVIGSGDSASDPRVAQLEAEVKKLRGERMTEQQQAQFAQAKAAVDNRVQSLRQTLDAPITEALAQVDLSEINTVLSAKAGFPVDLGQILAQYARTHLVSNEATKIKYNAALDHAVRGVGMRRGPNGEQAYVLSEFVPTLVRAQTNTINALLAGMAEVATRGQARTEQAVSSVQQAPRIQGSDQGTFVQHQPASANGDVDALLKSMQSSGGSPFDAARDTPLGG